MSDGGLHEAVQYLWAGGAGIFGRAMYHMHLIQKGERKSLIWMICDMLIALGIGWIVLGLGQWAGVSWQTTQSLGILAGWGGPHFVNRLLVRVVNGTGRMVSPEDDTKG